MKQHLWYMRELTWAVKLSAPFGGSFLESPATIPLLISFTDTFLTLKPTLSPKILVEQIHTNASPLIPLKILKIGTQQPQKVRKF